MSAALSLAICLAWGFFLVSPSLPNRGRSFSEWLFVGSSAFGFGLAIFSAVYFLSLLLQTPRLIVADAITFALLTAMFVWRRYRQIPGEVGLRRIDVTESPWLQRLLSAGFAIALCCAIYSALMRSLAYPNGDGWDAFSIWNLHARFLFRGGQNWRDGFTAVLPWSHPDYPLLLPGAIAHVWTFVGRDIPSVPAVIGMLFTFSTAGLLFSALSILNGRCTALLGTTILLATPSFIELGTSQYADVPLSFYFLAAIVLLCLHDARSRSDAAPKSVGLLPLAGLAASFAAWTKNEGLFFLCAIVLARLFALVRGSDGPALADRIRSILPMFVTIVPAIFLIAGFKHYVAPPGDLFSSANMLHKLVDPLRYWAITKWYVKEFFRFGRWMLVPIPALMIAYFLAIRKKEVCAPSPGLRTSMLALALTLTGYFAVYLITPYDIYWHLRFSLSRLFIQLWPSAIFVFFAFSPIPTSNWSTTGNSSASHSDVNVSK